MSSRNELEMLSITVRSCLEELSDIPDSEIVICDNSNQEIWEVLPEVIADQYLKDEKVRIIRQDYPCLFTARERAINAARGEYVIMIDSHMLIGHNTFNDLVAFMDQNRKNKKLAFAHAPLMWCHRHESNAVHDRHIEKSELGPWGVQKKTEQKITWKGMPWICRKNFFRFDLNGYGALSQNKLSWGGGDMLIGTKPWLLGFENWAVPTRPCTHIGPFPESIKGKSGYKYRIYSNSGHDTNTLGFLVACYVLGGKAMMRRNAPLIAERFKLDIDKHWNLAVDYGQKDRKWLLENQAMSYEEYLSNKPWQQ